MPGIFTSPILVSELAQQLGRDWSGDDLLLTRVSPLNDPQDGALSFATSAAPPADAQMCVIGTGNAGWSAHIESPNPRLDYARSLDVLHRSGHLSGGQSNPEIDESAIVSDQAIIGPAVRIGPRTIVEPFVHIIGNVTIGSDCWLRTGCVIGEQGFGFERDEEARPFRIRHLGGVEIGNHVEVGCVATVSQGTLQPTVIGDHVKLDDRVHIGHNCNVGFATMIAAHAELSGGVTVGDRVWIGPHASTLQKITIEDDATIGVGATVLRNVAAGATVMGRPGIEAKAGS